MVPSHRTSSHSLHARPLDARSPTRPLWYPACQGIASVVSYQSLSRTALNVSLLRHIAFVFRLLVCLVPSDGGLRACVSKGVEGKSRRRYIRTNICILTHLHHLHLQHPHSTPPIPLLVASPTDRHPMLRIAYLHPFVSNCCDLSYAGPHHILGDPCNLRDFLGLE